ncbi:hypothetical protein BDW62DRAFT_37554 [Aspergillus aurantiobrunneus]
MLPTGWSQNTWVYLAVSSLCLARDSWRASHRLTLLLFPVHALTSNPTRKFKHGRSSAVGLAQYATSLDLCVRAGILFHFLVIPKLA